MVMSELNNKISAVASNIRDISGETAAMGFDEMAAELEKVKTEIALQDELIEEAVAALDGKISGYKEAYDRGYEEGSAFYNNFWDVLQANGTRKDYALCFAYSYWGDATFKPKYDMTPTNASEMFRYSQITDINKCLEGSGIKMDFSTGVCTNFFHTFNCLTKTLPNPISLKKNPRVGRMFMGSPIERIELIDVNDFDYEWWNNPFYGCSKLKELYVDGVISSSFTAAQSPLIAESGKSVILALKDYSGTDKAYTNTLTLNATAWANLANLGATSPNGNTWREYADDKGWKT